MRRLRSLLIPIALGFLIACERGQSATQAIGQFAAAEDGAFAAERGAYRGEVKGLLYYETTLQLPGAASCAVYTPARGKPAFGTCDFFATDADDAQRIYQQWKQNTIAALPGWKTAELAHVPNGPVAAFQGVDDKQHAVYLYIVDDAGKYRITETFGTTSAFASH
ncbi:MAG TPA: hypothetical protein VK760_05245 [Candidatus Acidoferrales bacterium]|jgi:hypothetical protein|nr:hypothetical protein [Candidatus Acidoferrales bacterium]